MAVNYYNIEAINIILLDILEDIVVNIMDGIYVDENDEYLVYLITPLLSAINIGRTLSEDEPKEHNPILKDAVRKDEENIEESISLHSDELPSGDELVLASKAAPLGNNTVREDDGSKLSKVVEGDFILSVSSCTSSLESGPVDPTPTPKNVLLDEIMCAEVLDEVIEPVKGMAVMNIVSVTWSVGWTRQ